jgi:hypothetical protein
MPSKPSINVCIFQPPGYIHSLALLEAAEYVLAKSIESGHEAELVKNRLYPNKLNIVFGAHVVAQNKPQLPANTVIFNTEQLPENGVWNSPEYKNILQNHFVWDCSARNLNLVDHDDKQLVPFYHVEYLNRIKPAAEPEFDLIFYGSVNERRKKILDRLIGSGLRLANVFGLYGPERDAMLAKSRAVLNLHLHDAQLLQQIRAFYPLTNGIPVISEKYLLDSAPAIYRDVLFTPEGESIESYASSLLADKNRFAAEAQRKIGLFKSTAGDGAFDTALQTTVSRLFGKDGGGFPQAKVPLKINLGSGKDYRSDYLNIDIDERLKPDILFDFGAVFELPIRLKSPVYDEVEFCEGKFDEIMALDVLEHVHDLPRVMTNCLALLKEGGRFVINVPYELSLGAWQDPTHVRAFNENSWLYYTDWFWYLGWFTHRFDCTDMQLNYAELGTSLANMNKSQDEILRTPRAINSMSVVLVKRKTTAQEKTLARAYGNSLVGVPRQV